MISRRGFTLIELLIVIAIIAILALIAIPNFLEAQTRAKVSRAQADMRSIATALESYFVDHNSYPICSRGSWPPVDKQSAYHGPLGIKGTLVATADSYLTTPIAYLSGEAPVDPFAEGIEPPGFAAGRYDHSYYYYSFLAAHKQFIADSAAWDGPSQIPPHPRAFVVPAPMKFNGEDSQVYRAHWAMLSPGPDRTYLNQHPAIGFDVNASYFLATNAHWNNLISGYSVTYDPTNGTISNGDIWRYSGGAIE